MPNWFLDLRPMQLEASDEVDSAAPAGAAGNGPFRTTAKVEVGENSGNMLPLKGEEQAAILFLAAIQQIETECMSGSAKRACSMDQIMTSDASHAEHLKLDPKTDPNYTYTLAVNGTAWEAHATRKKPLLLGFILCSGARRARRWRATIAPGRPR